MLLEDTKNQQKQVWIEIIQLIFLLVFWLKHTSVSSDLQVKSLAKANREVLPVNWLD